MQLINISIHAAREGGDGAFVKIFIGYCISIHAAREGGDCFGNIIECSLCISIHAAREGGDCRPVKCFWDYIYFNPRRP